MQWKGTIKTKAVVAASSTFLILIVKQHEYKQICILFQSTETIITENK